MRFDLEIPATNNIELSFIEEDNAISNNLVPLLYIKNNTKDLFPSDFIQVLESYKPREFSIGGFNIEDGPVIKNIKSDKFILTNKIKSISIDEYIPLFYKYILNDKVKIESIRIIDYFGIQQDKNTFLVEELENKTIIYINKVDKILFVEYTLNNNIKKELLDPIPVFSEMEWEDIQDYNIIPEDKYLIYNKNIETSYNGKLYISYLSEIKMFRNAIGNIDDPWHIGILNAEFSINNNLYKIPEFYLQNFIGDTEVKFVEHKKCFKVYDNYIKTQYPIYNSYKDRVFVYVYNYNTNELKYIFTTNIAYNGLQYSDNIYYNLIENINSDGIIGLPINLEEDDIVFASYYTMEHYYEYKYLDLNTRITDLVDYFVIYIRPNVNDNERSVFHAIIGDYKSDSIEVYKDLDDYYLATQDKTKNCYNAYTVAVVGVVDSISNNILEIISTNFIGNKIYNKKEAAKYSIDIIYNDILNGSIKIPTNDSVLVSLNIKPLINRGYIKLSKDDIDNFSRRFLKTANRLINNTLSSTTSHIIEVNM